MRLLGRRYVKDEKNKEDDLVKKITDQNNKETISKICNAVIDAILNSAPGSLLYSHDGSVDLAIAEQLKAAVAKEARANNLDSAVIISISSLKQLTQWCAEKKKMIKDHKEEIEDFKNLFDTLFTAIKK